MALAVPDICVFVVLNGVKAFNLSMSTRPHEPGAKDQMVDTEMNVSGSRDTYEHSKSASMQSPNVKNSCIKRLARKTMCFPGSFEVYEKAIGAYVEKQRYN
ncbi:hypothetical protein HC231_08960 [Brenneria izadpanahii]|uniref:Uncharacterized protein n=1 Tax=Brenneria izadpanahii TaxID=2722756 RepID=A0ABX7UR06_9GAMM|nr:IS1 family transposase [Brenneria izadpanahii]QTF08034.1 hypothetical protein HC231_08960 [Brenneria izadpanahii]